MGVIVEVCVDTSAGLAAAVEGGADRIELCSALSAGGLTPSPGFMHEAAKSGLPVLAMIRPRAGDFVYSEAEFRQMAVDIAMARSAGLAGVVVGASLPDGQLDRDFLARLLDVAKGMDRTLHRAFDLAPDHGAALEMAIELGFSRVLTSGGAVRATEGAGKIAALIAQAAGRISVMPGSGVTAENAAIFTSMGAGELHASCAAPVPTNPLAVALGFGAPNERRTDPQLVRALRQAVH